MQFYLLHRWNNCPLSKGVNLCIVIPKVQVRGSGWRRLRNFCRGHPSTAEWRERWPVTLDESSPTPSHYQQLYYRVMIFESLGKPFSCTSLFLFYVKTVIFSLAKRYKYRHRQSILRQTSVVRSIITLLSPILEVI